MRGDHTEPDAMFSYISAAQRVPEDHPLRAIRTMVDKVLEQLSPTFDRLYSRIGWPSIPPERLLRALLLQVLYSIRSERTGPMRSGRETTGGRTGGLVSARSPTGLVTGRLNSAASWNCSAGQSGRWTVEALELLPLEVGLDPYGRPHVHIAKSPGTTRCTIPASP
jgi:hypothetical protein